jgi:acetolactate synthase-1/2/3 large subunit
MTGGWALATMLRAQRVGPMFGMGGFQLLPFYEAVRELGMTHHLVNDERCGVFAADSWSRLSMRPAVCDATLGPGATNLVTGLVESLNAGSPLIAITGDTHRGFSGRNMTQEGPQLAVLAAAAKALIRIEDGNRIPELVRRAFRIATSGRPGPVVLDVPEDVSHGEFSYPAGAFASDERASVSPATRCRPDGADVAAAAALLGRAERPLVVAGGGVHLSGAWAALGRLAHDFEVPVAYTMSGKGCLADDDDRCVGLVGRYSRYANDLADRADLVVSVGCKLGEVATKRYTLPPPDVALVQLDIEPSELGHWRVPAVGMWGDVRLGLEDLCTALAELPPTPHRRQYFEEIAARRVAWQEEASPRYLDDGEPIGVGRLLKELNAVMPREGILVADGGFAAHWSALLYDTKRAGRSYVADRGFASIGYGLPGAIGAALAEPDRPVVALTGDAGLNMSIGELETARRLGCGITLVVINNAASGYVKALQHAVFGAGHYQSSDLCEVDFAAVANSYGCAGERVVHPSQLRPALEAGIAERRVPTVVDVSVTRDPAQMLPGIDNRTLQVRPGDRPA